MRRWSILIEQGNPRLTPADRKRVREIYSQWLETHCITEDNHYKWMDKHTAGRLRKEVIGYVQG